MRWAELHKRRTTIYWDTATDSEGTAMLNVGSLPIRKCVLCIAIVAWVLSLTPVFANDTTAELATGGLVFTKSEHIEMQSEELFISTKEIRVQYHFFNNSNNEFVTQVAFPMPDIPYGADDFNFAVPTTDPQNILGFTTTVNGRPVEARVEQKAFVGGTDRTEILRHLNVPITPPPDQNLDFVSQSKWDELIRFGLARLEDNGKDDRHIYAHWTLKTTYYWQQSFPAHQKVVIDHRYLPSVGGVVPMSASDLINHPGNLQIDRSKGINRYCIDQTFLAAIAKPSDATWEQHFLEYILVTGANWSGPIKNFRLVVDKGSPNNLVSFCGQGVRKISPTQLELRISQFIPTSNLNVLILSPAISDPTDARNVDSNLPALNCDQLWRQRNGIFKAAGYCFHTPRAISMFGNAGCAYDNQFDVPLSARDRQIINMIQQLERMKRCAK